MVYLQQEHFPQAIDNFTRAIAAKPNYAAAYNNRGSAYLMSGNLLHAIQECNQAIALKPDLAPAYFNRAEAHRLLQQLEQARDDCTRALKIQVDAATLRKRAEVYWEMKDYDNAWRDLRRCQELGSRVDAAFVQAVKKAAGVR